MTDHVKAEMKLRDAADRQSEQAELERLRNFETKREGEVQELQRQLHAHLEKQKKKANAEANGLERGRATEQSEDFSQKEERDHFQKTEKRRVRDPKMVEHIPVVDSWAVERLSPGKKSQSHSQAWWQRQR